MSFFEFPHSRTYDSDLGWLIAAMKQLAVDTETFIKTNTIKFSDPIEWEITKNYESNTIVLDSDGAGYISRQPVPAGVPITNNEYWTRIFSFQQLVIEVEELRRQIAAADEGESETASGNREIGDLIWLNGVLFKAITDITIGTRYIKNSNVERVTIESWVNEIENYFNSEIVNINTRIDNTNTRIDNTNTRIDNINTEIDNINIVSVKDFGAIGDGLTDDTNAFIAAIATNKNVIVPDGLYKLTYIPDNTKLYGYGVILYNNHNIPVEKGSEKTIYLSDFVTLSKTSDYINHLKINNIKLIIDIDIDTINTESLYSLYLHNYNLQLEFNNATIGHIDVTLGNVTIINPIWSNTTSVSHLYVSDHAIAILNGVDSVQGNSTNFHLWCRNHGILRLNCNSIVNNNIFEYFLYAECGAEVIIGSYSWSGTLSRGASCCFTQNATCECNVGKWETIITYFPTAFNESSPYQYLPFVNVGSVFGSVPDYGWYRNLGVNQMDMTGKTSLSVSHIPDLYHSLTIYGRNLKTTSTYMHLQVKVFGENSYKASRGDYIGNDIQYRTSGFKYNTNTSTTENPIYITLPFNIYRIEDDSVSAFYFAGGTNPISFEITFLQYQGLSDIQYIGWVIDGAGTKHDITGSVKHTGDSRIEAIRLLVGDAFTEGEANIIQSF